MRERNPTSAGNPISRWLPLGVLLILWALFHWKVLFGDRTFVLLDCSSFFFPLWTWGARVFAQGILPLWNPDAGFGTPYWADPQMAVSYLPLRVLYGSFRPVTAFNFLITGHHLLMLAGFWVLARSRGASPWLSAAMGLIGGFSFNAITLLGVPAIAMAFAWVPWVLWAVDKTFQGGREAFLVLSLFLALQLSAGYPLFTYLTYLLSTLEWVARRKDPGLGGAWWKGWPTLLGSAMLALLFNALWVLPLAEFIPLSVLKDRVAFSGATEWGCLWTLLDPFREGHPLRSFTQDPHLFSGYFAGLPLLAVLLWGAWNRVVGGLKWVPLGTCLLLSLGEKAWVGGWLKGFFPGYSLVVRSGYWIPFFIASAILLLPAILKGGFLSGEGNKGRSSWVVACTCVYGGALWAGVPWVLPSFWVSYLLVVGMGWERIRPSARNLSFFLAILFSLGPMARSLNFTMERSFYEDPGHFGTGSSSRTYHSPVSAQGLRWTSGKSVREAYQNLKDRSAPNLPLAFGREEVDYSNALLLRSYLRWYLLSGEASSASAVKILGYFRAECPVEEPCPGISPLPKWFSVKETLLGRDWADCVRWTVEPGFLFSRSCVVATSEEGGAFQPRQVRETRRGLHHLELEVLGGGRAQLVSSETAYPGWRAKVGDREVPLSDVNYGFRGLLLEDGQEKVELNYRPLTFRLGCFLTLLSCWTWTVLGLTALRRRSRA